MRFLPLFIFVLLSSDLVRAQSDTLRYHNPSNTGYSYGTSFYVKQNMRFDLPAPAMISEIIVTLGGPKDGVATMHLYGQEAGSFVPQLEEELIEPVTLSKTKEGIERIAIPLKEPVFLANNQFFVSVDNFSADVFLSRDNTDHSVPCESSSGGTYYYQTLITTSGDIRVGMNNTAAEIDVVLNYPVRKSPRLLADITAKAGIDTLLSNKSIAVADIDDDGYLDLMVDGKVYQNNKDATFTDVTSSLGVSGRPRLNVFVDVDNDGYLDIFHLGMYSDPEKAIIYYNDGAGSYTSTVIDSLAELKTPSSISFADLNYDGYPDFFTGQLWDSYPDALPNYLFYSDGQSGFKNQSKKLYDEFDANRRSRGSSFVDYDNDGDLDLYVTNYYLEPDEFYENENGSFTDIRFSKQIDQNQTGSNHGTGVDWADFDNDGDMDLLLPQFAHPRFVEQYDHRPTTIYRNEGETSNYAFKDLRNEHGIEFEETQAGGTWGDVNNDGLQDFFITTYYGCRYVDLYLQKPDHSFQLKTFEYGLNELVTGEDAVWADFNNDGRLDLASGKNNRFRLYLNEGDVGHRFLQAKLVSSTANKQAIGARVYLYAEGRQFTREITTGRGQRMQDPYRLHFGLRWVSEIDSMVILWPDKNQTREIVTELEPYHFYRIEQGKGVTKEYEVNDDGSWPALNIKEEDVLVDEKIRVYPNPFRQSTKIEINVDGNFEVFLFDRKGSFLRKLHKGNNSAIVALDAFDLKIGSYFIVVKSSKGISYEQVSYLGR